MVAELLVFLLLEFFYIHWCVFLLFLLRGMCLHSRLWRLLACLLAYGHVIISVTVVVERIIINFLVFTCTFLCSLCTIWWWLYSHTVHYCCRKISVLCFYESCKMQMCLSEDCILIVFVSRFCWRFLQCSGVWPQCIFHEAAFLHLTFIWFSGYFVFICC